MRPGLPQNHGSHSEAGIGLLDLAIGVGLLLIVLGLVYPGFKVARDTMSTSRQRDLMECSGDKLLGEVTQILRSGQIVSMAEAPSPPSVTVRQPRSSVDIETLDGEVPWEAESREIRFQQASVLDEAQEQIDLNRDGDQVDSFALGYLEQVIGAVARPISRGATVALALPGYAGDLDGDGEGDPLFRRDGSIVVVSVHLVSRGDGGRLLHTRVGRTVHLRNAQE